MLFVVAIGAALAGCGDDDADDPAATTDTAAGVGTSVTEAGEAAVVIEPADSPTSRGRELTLGTTGDFAGVLVTVDDITASDTEPVSPDAAGTVEVALTVQNTTDGEAVAPSASVLCDDLTAGAGAAHPSDVMTDTVEPGATVSGAVVLDVPADCDGPALVLARLAGVEPDENPPIAHVPLPDNALG